MILTAKQGMNADLFPDILQLYVPQGSSVLDMTWGKGRFWQKVPPGAYRVVGLDIDTPRDVCGDFRILPFREESFDCAVLDPPYATHGTPMKRSIATSFNLDVGPRSYRELHILYGLGIAEAWRVLRRNGVLIIKAQDQIESNRQVWTHAWMLDLGPGWVAEDLFVLVQKGIPAARWPYQKHARKNHSYFIVQRKK